MLAEYQQEYTDFNRALNREAYLHYSGQKEEYDLERIYDRYKSGNLLERIPYVLANAVQSIIAQADAQTATQMKSFDPKKVVDNSIVERLVKEGFFEKLFGAGIKAEQDGKLKLALR